MVQTLFQALLDATPQGLSQSIIGSSTVLSMRRPAHCVKAFVSMACTFTFSGPLEGWREQPLLSVNIFNNSHFFPFDVSSPGTKQGQCVRIHPMFCGKYACG